MNLEERRQTMQRDPQYIEGTILKVEEDGDYTYLNWQKHGSDTSGWWIGFKKETSLSSEVPKAGDSIRLYGRGIGYDVRGIVVNGHMHTYETEEEMEERQKRQIEEQRQQRRQEYENRRQEYEDRINALPEVFQKKLRGHMSRVDDYAPDTLPYDLFISEEAVKIANHFQDVEKIYAWYNMDYDRQKDVFSVSDGHSGNTFGAACNLAAGYLKIPEHIPRYHSAMDIIAGCERCGCWAAYEGRTHAKDL